MLHRPLSTLAFALGLALATSSQAMTVAGVTLPEQVSMDEHLLQLNGAGLREEFVFDVYVAALYTSTPSQNAQTIIDSPKPQQIRLYLLRSITLQELNSSLKNGMQNNLNEQEQAELSPALLSFEKSIQEIGAANAGDTITLSLMGDAVVIHFNERQIASVSDPKLGAALLQIWLGNNPAQPSLKAALLGLAS